MPNSKGLEEGENSVVLVLHILHPNLNDDDESDKRFQAVIMLSYKYSSCTLSIDGLYLLSQEG